MIAINRPLFALMLATGPTPAFAQVIEISATGEAQTYDGPTMFTATAAVPIGPERARAETVGDPALLIEQAARIHRLDPTLLKAVAWQESRGRMRAISPRGALGVMQLMPATASELGVDPRVMTDNIRGGAIYLRRQLDRFGTVPLALAAYNAGPGAVLRYGGIPPYRETRSYVARIMARWRPIAEIPLSSMIVEVIK